MAETTFVSTEQERPRRRRGLLVFLLIGSTVATIGTAAMSLALFTDTASSSGSFTAGTIDINTSPATLFTVTNMMPGDSVSATLNVANGGSAQLRYAMTSSSTNTDTKALRDQLTLTIRPGTCPSAAATIYSGPLSGASFGSTTAGAQAGDRTLNPTPTNEDLCFTVTLPGGVSTGNAFQGATTTTTFTFSAEQTANN